MLRLLNQRLRNSYSPRGRTSTIAQEQPLPGAPGPVPAATCEGAKGREISAGHTWSHDGVSHTSGTLSKLFKNLTEEWDSTACV